MGNVLISWVSLDANHEWPDDQVGPRFAPATRKQQPTLCSSEPRDAPKPNL